MPSIVIPEKPSFRQWTVPAVITRTGLIRVSDSRNSQAYDISDSVFAIKLKTAVQREGNFPLRYELGDNYPNLFNPSTHITYSIPNDGFVSLRAFDILGRETALLVNEIKGPGVHTVEFNAASLSGGTYFYELKANGFASVKKMLIIK